MINLGAVFNFFIVLVELVVIGALIFVAIDFISTDARFKKIAKIAVGVKDSERNISNKISRGTFTAIWFIQCMEAIGAKTIHLEDN